MTDKKKGSDVDLMFSAAYEELRRLASHVRRNDPGASLSPTTLVNEAWLRLAGSPGLAPESQLHFKRIAARAMRQVLIEAARRRHAAKRGGDAPRVTFDESVDGVVTTAAELLQLNAALDELGQANPRQAQMVECRFFGGLSVEETAQAMGVSEATIARDWRVARAWLAGQLGAG